MNTYILLVVQVYCLILAMYCVLELRKIRRAKKEEEEKLKTEALVALTKIKSYIDNKEKEERLETLKKESLNRIVNQLDQELAGVDTGMFADYQKRREATRNN